MSPLDQTSLDLARPAYDLEKTAAASLRAGKVFTCLLIDGPASRFAAVEAVLKQVADPKTRIVQISNPLRSALTLERVLIQVLGPEADLRADRTDEQRARLLARPLGDETRLLIVMHQSETLDIATREILGRMAAFFPKLTPRVQILFCGPTTFRPPVPSPEPAWTLAPVQEHVEEPGHRSRRQWIPFLLFLFLFAIAGAVLWQAYPDWFAPLRHLLPESTVQLWAPRDAKPSAEARPASVDDVAALRREFDAFLAERAPALAASSQAQKDALFAEFLDRRRAQQTR